MGIKWIVTDMDGTLLNRAQQITQRTKDALIEWQKQGVKVILASGRSNKRLETYGKQLELQQYGGYFIEVNGMAIQEVATGKREIFGRLNQAQIHEIFTCLQELGAEIQGYLDDTIYYHIPEQLWEVKKQYRKLHEIAEAYPWLGGDFTPVADVRNGYPHQYAVTQASQMADTLNKIAANQEPEWIAAHYKIIKERLQENFEVVQVTERIIEFTPKGITKGNALKRLMDHHGVQTDEVLVFGDGENDLSMFEQVKYCIAMGNALDLVKEKAYDLTSSHEEDGLAAGLKKYSELFERS